MYIVVVVVVIVLLLPSVKVIDKYFFCIYNYIIYLCMMLKDVLPILLHTTVLNFKTMKF